LFLLGVVLRSQLATFLDITPELSSSSPFILVEINSEKENNSIFVFQLDWPWFNYLLYRFICILVNI